MKLNGSAPKASISSARKADAIRIGFVPLADCATLAIADRLGFFDRHSVSVELVREPGWASIRDKIIYGELEMAHAVVGLPFAISYGLGSLRHACETAFVFNVNGDAITLSSELVSRGVTDANQLAVELKTSSRERSFILGIPHPFSAHHFILNQWLKPAGILPGRDVQLQVLPPSLMSTCLEQGHIDGFCVGEPYNTVAEQSGVGEMVALSSDVSPAHPEKVLLTTQEFSERRNEEHLAVIAALIEASEYCDTAEGRSKAAVILAEGEFLGLDPRLIEASLLPRETSAFQFHQFFGPSVNSPDSDKASWVISNMRASGLMDDLDKGVALAPSNKIFRHDLYEQALEKTNLPTTKTK